MQTPYRALTGLNTQISISLMTERRAGANVLCNLCRTINWGNVEPYGSSMGGMQLNQNQTVCSFFSYYSQRQRIQYLARTILPSTKMDDNQNHSPTHTSCKINIHTHLHQVNLWCLCNIRMPINYFDFHLNWMNVRSFWKDYCWSSEGVCRSMITLCYSECVGCESVSVCVCLV